MAYGLKASSCNPLNIMNMMNRKLDVLMVVMITKKKVDIYNTFMHSDDIVWLEFCTFYPSKVVFRKLHLKIAITKQLENRK